MTEKTSMRSDRRAKLFVLGVGMVCLLTVVAHIGLYGRNTPLAEDWNLVPPLTGNESNLLGWLWSQNNEHRLPLPRLLHLLLLKMTGGDFRAGMVFNTLSLAVLALLMVNVAASLRGGRMSYSDAFFPIALLHLGHWPNLVWSWQIQFALAVFLVSVLLLLIVQTNQALNRNRAFLIGCLILFLPLAGASSLIFLPPLTLWIAYVIHRASGTGPSRLFRSAPLVLSIAVFGAWLLCLVYFFGYEKPYWRPPNPGISETLKTSVKILVLGLGRGVLAHWKLCAIAVGGLLAATGVLLTVRLRRGDEAERGRLVGLLCFLAGAVSLALGIGWARAGYVPTVGIPARYALLSVPTLCAAYFAWVIYASERTALVVTSAIFGAACLALPYNVSYGLSWRDWYHNGMEAFERDLAAGLPVSELAKRHRDFLLHWNENQLAERLRMLQEARMGPYR